MPQDTEKKEGWIFISVRSKLLVVYLAIVLGIFVALLVIFPRVFKGYMLERAGEDLLSTRQIIQETLEENDFRTSPYQRDKLDAVARAKGIEIWICEEAVRDSKGNLSIPTMGFGGDPSSQTISLSAESGAFIEQVRSGRAAATIFENKFPEYYSRNTLTMAYPVSYHVLRTFPSENEMDVNVEATAVVLLNRPLADISDNVHSVQLILIVIFLLLAVGVGLAIWAISNNMIQSIHQMRDVSAAISKGDFFEKVEVHSHDEIGELAASFNAMAEELARADETQKEFIGNISHDFRSPLTSIRGFAEAMLDDIVPPEQHKKYLQIIYDETNRLNKLANDMLLLNKMESGQEELQIHRFDINEMIVSLSLSFEQRIEEKGLDMQFRFLQDHLFVMADEDKIERVIYNLIDNAIKFTEKGDSITVETSIVNKKAYITVTDTGIGMDEETQKHIFERFRKGDKSRGLNKTGMGLGLAIVKQIILNHGEEILCRSREGQGTSFEFTLPLANQISFVEKK